MILTKFYKIARVIFYIFYILFSIIFLITNKLNNILYGININSFIQHSLTVLSIFFSFLLLLADNLTNSNNIKNLNSVNGIYFLKNIFLENKIKIYFSYFVLLINIIYLLILSCFIKEESFIKNINIYVLKFLFIFTFFSLVHAFFIISTIINNNKNNIEEDLKIKEKEETDKIKSNIK